MNKSIRLINDNYISPEKAAHKAQGCTEISHTAVPLRSHRYWKDLSGDEYAEHEEMYILQRSRDHCGEA